MQIRERKLPWWLIIVTGLLIITAGIFVLVDNIKGYQNGLNVLVFLTGLGALSFGVYNFIVAYRTRSDNSMFLAYLVQGIIDIVLLLLIIIIRNSHLLLGVIIACWMMVFGVFEVITGRRNDNHKHTQLGAIFALVGLVVLVIPLIFSIDYLTLIGIVGIVFGVLRVVLGIMIKANEQGTTSKVV